MEVSETTDIRENAVDITTRTSNYDGLSDEYLRGENEKGWLFLGTGPWSIMDELAYRIEQRAAKAKAEAVYRQKLDSRPSAVRILLAPECANTVVRVVTLSESVGYRVQCVPTKGAFAGCIPRDQDGPICYIRPSTTGWDINTWNGEAETLLVSDWTFWCALRRAVKSVSQCWASEQA